MNSKRLEIEIEKIPRQFLLKELYFQWRMSINRLNRCSFIRKELIIGNRKYDIDDFDRS